MFKTIIIGGISFVIWKEEKLTSLLYIINFKKEWHPYLYIQAEREALSMIKKCFCIQSLANSRITRNYHKQWKQQTH
jgi:hypothetical protein